MDKRIKFSLYDTEMGYTSVQVYLAALRARIEGAYLIGGVGAVRAYVRAWLNDARESRSSIARRRRQKQPFRHVLSVWRRSIMRAHVAVEFLQELRRADAR